MSYTHNDDTIAAMATASSENSISIIRLSGLKAINIANEIFSGPVLSYKSHTVHLGYALTVQGEQIDQCLLIVMKAPRSYTGEDTIEIHCHGGFFAPARILDNLFAAGARPALPGEFTFRAFMNGKIDLIQAEAVQKIIMAQNGEAFSIAQDELSGKLSQRIQLIKEKLLTALALIEAYLDFPEDIDSLKLKERLTPLIQDALEITSNLVDNFDEGRRILSGTEMAIIGEPNVGKSSLLNILTQKNAAIVSSIPGTTRDFVKEEIMLNGKIIKLIDTAGIRTTSHPIEKEGVRRTEALIDSAAVILWVVDTTHPPKTPLKNISPINTILVWNKIDLSKPKDLDFWPGTIVNISTKTGDGITELKQVIYSHLKNTQNAKENVFLITQRQFNNLKNIQNHLLHFTEELSDLSHPECLATTLRLAVEETGLLSGFHLNEHVLDEIFGQFCVGK